MQLTPRRPRKPPYSHTSWALAVAVAAAAFSVSYAGQRLLSLALGEPAMGEVATTGHTPYYWRVALAILHALIALSLVRLAIDNERAESVLRWAPVWIPCVVLPLALVLVGLP